MSATPAIAPRLRMSPLGDADTDSPVLLPTWSDGAGWGVPQYYETMRCAPIAGDPKHQQLLIRGPAGILVQTFKPEFGYWVPLPDGPGLLSDVNGWNEAPYYSCLLFADVNGDHSPELITRGVGGVYAWSYSAGQQTWTELPRGLFWSYGAGGSNVWTYQSMCAGDINNDGRAELLALTMGNDGFLFIDAWNYDPTTQTWHELPAPPASLGLGILPLPQSFETLACADVNGDGIDEVLILLGGGLAVLFFDAKTQTWTRGKDLTGMAASAGWNHPDSFRTIRYGSLHGEATMDVIGRRFDGAMVGYSYNPQQADWELFAEGGNSPGDPPMLIGGADWTQPQYYSTIQLADIDGDGRDELLARGPGGLVFWRYNINGTWSSAQESSAFSDATGWDQAPYYSTLRYADVNGDGCAEVIGRGADGVWTLKWTPQGWKNTCGDQAAFPSFTGDEQSAYASISQQLTQFTSNQTDDIRSLYGLATTDFDALIGDLGTSVQRPQNIPQPAWDPVYQQIDRELNVSSAVKTWFDLIRGFLSDTFASESLTVNSVQNLVQMSTGSSSTGLVFQILSVVCDIAWAVLGVFPGLTGDANEIVNFTLASGAAGLMSGVFSAATISNGGQDTSISTTVGDLQYNLGNWYTNIKNATDSLQASAATDWGLLRALADGPAWPIGFQDQLTTNATQGYNLALFQLLMPLKWYAAFWKDNSVPLGGYPTQYSYWDGTCMHWLQDNYTDLNTAKYPNDELFQILFTTGTGNLGASVSDVLLGNNGWTTPLAQMR